MRKKQLIGIHNIKEITGIGGKSNTVNIKSCFAVTNRVNRLIFLLFHLIADIQLRSPLNHPKNLHLQNNQHQRFAFKSFQLLQNEDYNDSIPQITIINTRLF